MRYHEGQPGVQVDSDGRLLIWYKDQFGRMRSKHILFCNRTQVEFRTAHMTVTCGTVVKDENGNMYIRIELPDDYEM